MALFRSLVHIVDAEDLEVPVLLEVRDKSLTYLRRVRQGMYVNML